MTVTQLDLNCIVSFCSRKKKDALPSVGHWNRAWLKISYKDIHYNLRVWCSHSYSYGSSALVQTTTFSIIDSQSCLSHHLSLVPDSQKTPWASSLLVTEICQPFFFHQKAIWLIFLGSSFHFDLTRTLKSLQAYLHITYTILIKPDPLKSSSKNGTMFLLRIFLPKQ